MDTDTILKALSQCVADITGLNMPYYLSDYHNMTRLLSHIDYRYSKRIESVYIQIPNELNSYIPSGWHLINPGTFYSWYVTDDILTIQDIDIDMLIKKAKKEFRTNLGITSI